jgi:Ca2+-transporting ATPase
MATASAGTSTADPTPGGFRHLRTLPGRIRAEISGLRDDPGLARRIERLFRTRRGVRAVQANPATGRVLILYDPGATGPRVLLDDLRSLESFQRVHGRGGRPDRLREAWGRHPRNRASLLIRSFKPVVASAIVAVVAIKVGIAGHGRASRSERLNALSVLLSATNGYPQLRRVSRVLLGPGARAELAHDIVDYASIATKGVRESLLGLSATAGSHLLDTLEETAHWRAGRKIRRPPHVAGHARLRFNDGREVAIPVSELQPGAVIRLSAEEQVPADGRIEEGNGLLDERVIGTPAILVSKGPGDPVYLGTRLERGALVVRIVATRSHTRVGRVLRQTPELRERAIPRAVDRAIRRISSAGIVLAGGTLLATWNWRRALAVLAAFNPASLQHAAQAASGAAVEVARAAGARVLRRGAFEALARADVVLFSTAALAAQSPLVDPIVPLGGARAQTVLTLAASALRDSTHPLSVPLVEKARELALPVPDASPVEEIPGRGVRSRDAGADVLVGDARFMADHGISLDASSEVPASLHAQGNAALFVARDGRLLGAIGTRVRLQPGAGDALRGLRAAGVTGIGVLGAGSEQPASSLVAGLGVQRIWRCLGPEGKRAVVRRLQRAGHTVAIVGASAGDMLAMAQADVAIGLTGPGWGWTPLVHVSHVLLPDDRLGLLPGLVALSRRVMSEHGQSIIVAGTISTAGGAAAVAGLLPFGMADEVNHTVVLVLLASARRLSTAAIEPARHVREAVPVRGPAWHALTSEEVVRLLATDDDAGLSAGDAALRLARRGPNALAEAPPPGLGALFARQLLTGMTLLLGAAAGASALIGESLNAALIAGVVVVNAGLGAGQEYRAERAIAALRRYTAPVARCRRDGRLQSVRAADLVPGDIVLLHAGDAVPADGRILESYACEVVEAVLTGEAVPALKNPDPVPPNAVLAERTCMVYMGTAVAAGRARAVIVATGMDTAVGHIAGLLEQPDRAQTPLGTRLATVSRSLAGLALAGGGLFVAAGLVRGLPVASLVMGGVSLVTAAVPEGLPAVVTIALSAAVQRMSRRSLIVRRLSAVEMLGRVTVICCDKTGTLTQNRMAVRALVSAGLAGVEEPGSATWTRDEIRWLLTIGAVCNDATMVDVGERATLGSHTEGALVLVAADAGLDVVRLRREYARVAELPFATERAYMAVVCRRPAQGLVLLLKGAPETIVELCDRRGPPGQTMPLDMEGREQIRRLSDEMAYEAMRVLAMAYRPVDTVPPEEWLEHPGGCVFAGLVGMTDPLRPDVRDAVARCERAGIRVVMATGDHRSTAIAIARQLGLPFERQDVLEGRDLQALPDADLLDRLPRLRVLARVTPEDKLRVITAMRARGDVVAMTGDGVNDAPAIKRADVGIAMGRGSTEVTRQASSIIVGDASFTSIVRAIEEGRGVRRNLRRAIGFLLGGNLGEALFVLGSTLIGGRMPLLPIHLLLVNLFTDALPVMALAGLPAPSDVLDRPMMGELFDRGFYQDAVRRGLVTGMAATAIYGLGAGADSVRARSLALTGLVASQLVQAQHWRSREHADTFFSVALGVSWTALGAILALPGLQQLFGTAPLGALDWAWILASSFAADGLLRAGWLRPGGERRALPAPAPPARMATSRERGALAHQ